MGAARQPQARLSGHEVGLLVRDAPTVREHRNRGDRVLPSRIFLFFRCVKRLTFQVYQCVWTGSCASGPKTGTRSSDKGEVQRNVYTNSSGIDQSMIACCTALPKSYWAGLYGCWSINTAASSSTGSVHDCVPKAPPQPNAPALRRLPAMMGSITTATV